MKQHIIKIMCLLILIVACKEESTDQKFDRYIKNANSLIPKSIKKQNLKEKKLGKDIFGNRFEIEGDFDGDGIQEKLMEHYFDSETNKEVAKFIEGMEDATRTMRISPFSFMLSDNHKIDTLKIASGAQVSGVLFVKNEGDLNGDDKDEISYVIHWSDWSSINTWHIVTYRNNKWEELLKFPMIEFQLDRLNTNGSLIKKIGKNKFQISYLNDIAEEETKIMYLK